MVPSFSQDAAASMADTATLTLPLRSESAREVLKGPLCLQIPKRDEVMDSLIGAVAGRSLAGAETARLLLTGSASSESAIQASSSAFQAARRSTLLGALKASSSTSEEEDGEAAAYLLCSAAHNAYKSLYTGNCIEGMAFRWLTDTLEKAVVVSERGALARKLAEESGGGEALLAEEGAASSSAPSSTQEGLAVFNQELSILQTDALPLLQENGATRLPAVYFPPPFSYMLVFKAFAYHVEMLFAYDIVHQRLLETADKGNLWSLCSQGARAALVARVEEGQECMRTLETKAPFLFAKATVLLAARLLMHLKVQIAKDMNAAGLVPQSDLARFETSIERALLDVTNFRLWARK
mmetsp:Transcript_16395/g.33347  ORF Transcript_16395/g.33347 Transcript_16395/m.33347 type:complete len:353 (-) Transcript_16395:246-1304(-)